MLTLLFSLVPHSFTKLTDFKKYPEIFKNQFRFILEVFKEIMIKLKVL